MRRIKTVNIIALGIIAASSLGFWFGRCSALLLPVTYMRDHVEAEYDFECFMEIARGVEQIVHKHDGRIPADMYRALVDEGMIPSYTHFLFQHDNVEFGNIPCRINTDLEKNARAPFFWLTRRDAPEIWVYYLDGSFERESYRILDLWRSDNFRNTMASWERKFRGAGYPYWLSVEEHSQWCQDNDNRMEWNEEEGLYVPRPETP